MQDKGKNKKQPRIMVLANIIFFIPSLFVLIDSLNTNKKYLFFIKLMSWAVLNLKVTCRSRSQKE